MKWYRARIALRGPTGTPWQADTIFGHLCWVLRHLRGEASLKDFLSYFTEGQPLFLLSDGFPGDMLPRPVTLAAPLSERREDFGAARKARKVDYLSREDFLRALHGEQFIPQEPPEEFLPSTRVSLKNQISRLTGTTGEEGNLFPFLEYWAPKVTVYLKVENGFQDLAEGLFQGLAGSGYGKRKSVGYGAIKDIVFESFQGFPVPPGANAFVSLSPFLPAATDPSRGRWRLRVKYGRLGEEYAVGENPFKRPLLMLLPGSVFYDNPVREFYGGMVAEVSLRPEVVHYGYALPVPMCVKEAGE